MAWIDTAQQFALIKAEGDGVIGLPRTGFPRWLLTGQHDRQAIEVGDDAAVDRFVDANRPAW